MTQSPNRYAQMIRQMITALAEDTSAARPGMQSVSVVPVNPGISTTGPTSGIVAEIGILFPLAMRDQWSGDGKALPWDQEGIEVLTGGDWASLRIRDQAGHWRGVYDVLVPYCLSMAVWIDDANVPEKSQQILEQWSAWHGQQLKQFNWPNGALPAAKGTEISVACWRGVLAGARSLIDEAGDGLDLAEQVVKQIAGRQADNGSLLKLSRGDNPEPMWYHELQILHALGTLGAILKTGGRVEATKLAGQVSAKNAEYQQNETQPDHATTQPWGLNVAMGDMNTWPLADQLIQAALFNRAGRVDGISLMLLADSLYWHDRMLHRA